MSDEAAAQPAAPAKSRKLLFIIIAVLVVAGGGGGAYWKFFSSPVDPGAPAKPSEPSAIVNFDPFVVNLSDPGTPRFLRVTLGLVVEGEDHAKEFTENAVVRSQVRSSLLELLSEQQATQLVTPAGKDALKKSVIARAEHNAPELKVHDVLFTEFIVQ